MLASRFFIRPSRSLATTFAAKRTMATTIHDSVPHEDRTATQPRENTIEPVTISHVREINPTTRVLRLSPQDPDHTIRFLPGQWLDTFIPSLPKAGGFTITSPPAAATRKNGGYIELAVQKSSNPPAQYFHSPVSDILHSPLKVRVGGSFTFPPPNLDASKISRLVLIAGGVGINPLISIFSHLMTLHSSQRPEEIHVLYGTKAADSEADPQSILFLPRLMDLVGAAAEPKNVTLSLFLTGSTGYENGERIEHGRLPNRTWARRIGRDDLVGALDGWREGAGRASGREETVAYVCGPQKMTDEVVEFLGRQEGVERERVLCEKWW